MCVGDAMHGNNLIELQCSFYWNHLL